MLSRAVETTKGMVERWAVIFLIPPMHARSFLRNRSPHVSVLGVDVILVSSRTMDGALLLSESPTGIVKEGLFPNGILHVASSGHEGFVCSSAGVWH